MDGVDAVVHLGAVPDEAPFDAIAGPNLHGVYHVFEACRRAGVQRVVFASSNHASGMYPVGEPLDGEQRPRPDGLYGASKVFGEGLGSMYCRPLRVVGGVPADRLVPAAPARAPRALDLAQPRRRRAAGARSVDRRDVRFAIVYGASANTRRWWPPDTEIGFAPQDDAEAFADELEGEDYAVQGGPNAAPGHGGWAT